jgi:hypothetical protein
LSVFQINDVFFGGSIVTITVVEEEIDMHSFV